MASLIRPSPRQSAASGQSSGRSSSSPSPQSCKSSWCWPRAAWLSSPTPSTTFADATTAIPLWLAFLLARRKPTATFTYGYGRVEDLAGIAIVLIILFSALVAGYEAIDRIVHPQPITLLMWVAIAGLIGFIGNESRRGVSHPRRPRNQQRGAHCRRLPRPHRRPHEPRGRRRCHRCLARLSARRSDCWSTHHHRHLRHRLAIGHGRADPHARRRRTRRSSAKSVTPPSTSPV